MLLSLKSTGPDYNHIRTNINIPWNCEYIEYHVASINTRDVLIITDDDYVVLQWNDNDGRNTPRASISRLHDSKHITAADIFNIFHHLDANRNPIANALINGNTGRIEITPHVNNFRITAISYRASLITGLYNHPLNQVFPINVATTCNVPIFDFYNRLYLVSKQGQAIQSNIDDKEYTPSVIACIDHIIRHNVPIIQNFETYGKPIKNIVNIDSFKQIELELVDFKYQPIKLLSPMFITIKVNPAENPKMKLK
ncbi:hypothetical protein M9Y10_045016 [Tritrichomonas musculus]|uniref:Uncharacterized protein n=1 Tax=Tritrichomonas musculus TaxID=1915356 RepID=A0ABR2JU28_9EUKA